MLCRTSRIEWASKERRTVGLHFQTSDCNNILIIKHFVLGKQTTTRECDSARLQSPKHKSNWEIPREMQPSQIDETGIGIDWIIETGWPPYYLWKHTFNLLQDKTSSQ